MHYDVVLDLGFDYGAIGGQGWDTTIIAYPSGASRRNENRENALGRWEIGNRNIDAAALATLRDFLHAMRGRAHSFLFKDWGDYKVTEQQLVLDGTDETQLIKVYGLSINPWTRNIEKPKADTVVIEEFDGSAWVELTAGVDYELDETTGVITWTDAPDTSAQIRWSGEFYVRVRFDTESLDAQFLAHEERPNGDEDLAYHIGGLSVVEEPEE